MIQHISARQNGPVTNLLRQHTSDGPEPWGQWVNRKRYSLEIAQHPSRARMCGFGDKDRRPLAPAAVAKMVVRREDNSLVDVDDVDCSFFVVTADLWSADGKQEMNLVLHPSSAERYVPSNAISKQRKREKTNSAAPPRSSGQQTPATRSTPTPAQYRATDPPNGPGTPGAGTTYPTNQAFPFPQPAPPEVIGFPPPPPSQYSSIPSETSTWGYNQQTGERSSATFPPPVLPSIHTFGRSTASSPAETWQTNEGTEGENGASIDPSLRSSTDTRDNWSSSNNSNSNPATNDGTPYVPSQFSVPANTTPAAYFPTPSAGATPSSSALPQLPRHTYTRTLVGPLAANANRLMDEHRKPGIFFLFQDLSVRTEGTFRLRLRLMNIGFHPAPDPGATRLQAGSSPVLAQIFTEPFTVYSAKRFPGVPDTTALSIAFGNQGQKLPLRNRHGSSGNKRRRRDESGSEDDSDA